MSAASATANIAMVTLKTAAAQTAIRRASCALSTLRPLRIACLSFGQADWPSPTTRPVGSKQLRMRPSRSARRSRLQTEARKQSPRSSAKQVVSSKRLRPAIAVRSPSTTMTHLVCSVPFVVIILLVSAAKCHKRVRLCRMLDLT
jgi:hypothetical protein